MKIALLSTFDRDGGAAVAASRLHRGLRLLQQDSWLLVKCKSGRDPHTVQIDAPGPDIKKQEGLFRLIEELNYTRNRTSLSNTRFSLSYPGYGMAKNPVVQAADIVNLHWVALFQSVESVAQMMQTARPVVWTLHDMNPFSGGCHYSAGCLRYRTDCVDCPQLRENAWQLPARILQRKIKYWRRNLTIVTPSRWLAACARQSSVFRNFRVEVIPNSLETDVFIPRDKAAAKKKLGFSPEQTLLLFSAHSDGEKRKGFNELWQALGRALQNPRFQALVAAGAVRILNLGPHNKKNLPGGSAVHNLGVIDAVDEVAAVYAAADVLVMPSLEENLANVMLEAMACSTPVLAFAVGGTPDVIRNGATGFLVPVSDCDQLADRLLELVFDRTLREQMGMNCRSLIEEKFALKDQAANYIELFGDLLKTRPENGMIPDGGEADNETGGPTVNESAAMAGGEDFAREIAPIMPRLIAWSVFKNRSLHNLKVIGYLLKNRGVVHTVKAAAGKLRRRAEAIFQARRGGNQRDRP
jgi:glycosyltransferase involved in cell wall biosynthesis